MNLDEDMLLRKYGDAEHSLRIWAPDCSVVVLGRSNKSETEVYVERANKDNVEIVKRMGGGGTVVLTSGVLVISIAKNVSKDYYNNEYFRKINDLIISSLSRLGVRRLEHNGISDISINDKKILGSSIYRRKKLLFYQASLMVNPDTGLISRYLRHPSKEPEYRKSRGHGDFMTTLEMEGYPLSLEEVKDSLFKDLNEGLKDLN